MGIASITSSVELFDALARTAFAAQGWPLAVALQTPSGKIVEVVFTRERARQLVSDFLEGVLCVAADEVHSTLDSEGLLDLSARPPFGYSPGHFTDYTSLKNQDIREHELAKARQVLARGH